LRWLRPGWRSPSCRNRRRSHYASQSFSAFGSSQGIYYIIHNFLKGFRQTDEYFIINVLPVYFYIFDSYSPAMLTAKIRAPLSKQTCISSLSRASLYSFH
jgi:hypothetical protein